MAERNLMTSFCKRRGLPYTPLYGGSAVDIFVNIVLMSPLLSWPGVDHERVCGLSSTQMWWLQSRQTPPSLSCELSGSSSSHCVSQSQPTHTRVHHHTHHNTTPHTTSSPHLNYTSTTPQSVFQLQADVIENEFQCEGEMNCNKQSNMKSILWNILILWSGVKRRQWGLLLSGIECKHIVCEGPLVPQEDWTH